MFVHIVLRNRHDFYLSIFNFIHFIFYTCISFYMYIISKYFIYLNIINKYETISILQREKK